MSQIKEVTVSFGYTASMGAGTYEFCRIDMSETRVMDTSSAVLAKEEREAMFKKLEHQVMSKVDKITEK